MDNSTKQEQRDNWTQEIERENRYSEKETQARIEYRNALAEIYKNGLAAGDYSDVELHEIQPTTTRRGKNSMRIIWRVEIHHKINGEERLIAVKFCTNHLAEKTALGNIPAFDILDEICLAKKITPKAKTLAEYAKEILEKTADAQFTISLDRQELKTQSGDVLVFYQIKSIE